MSEDIYERDAALGGVLRQVSGQLRFSLGNICHVLERLAPPELRDEDSRLDMNAAVMWQSCYRIMRLADNLEDAASLGRPAPPRPHNTDIVRLCKQVVQEAQYPAELLGLELTFQSTNRTHIVLIDEERIKRMLMNLLSNAFKFTPKGGQVTVELRMEKKQIELSVADTGCGIREDLQDTIFDRYLHVERLDPPPHGLGLGLPICRQVAEEHGGTLMLTSAEGKGTTVIVSLPNKKERTQELRSEIRVLNNGFSRTLVELSDVLPKEAFVLRETD